MTAHAAQSMLRAMRRWVGWKEVPNEEGDKTRKIPFSVRGGRASSSNDSTWGAYDKAKRINGGHVGFMLGEVRSNYIDAYVCGLDLDGCLIDGKLIPDAQEVVDRFDTYTEVSPSGRGVHLLFWVRGIDVDKLRKLFNFTHRLPFAVGKKQEMALDVSNRYYTFTGEVYHDRDLVQVPYATLQWFARDMGPRQQQAHGKDKQSDPTESGDARRFFRDWSKSHGDDYEAAERAILKWQGRAGHWARTKGVANNHRELNRAWEKRNMKFDAPEEHKIAELKLASEIPMKRIDWLWRYYFAFGKIGMIAGQANKGKSMLTLDLIARVTTGGTWPDGTKAPTCSVILLSAEDDPSDTTIPRLVAAKANLDRVKLLSMTKTDKGKALFSLADDLMLLEENLEDDVRLLVIDPVTAYMGVGKMDSFKTTDVRGVLAPLAELSARKHISTILVTHFKKNLSLTDDAMNAITDSHAFPALARHVFGVYASPWVEEQFLFVPMKHNISKASDTLGWAYSIDDRRVGQGIRAPYVAWESDYVESTANDIAAEMASKRKRGSHPDDAREQARQLLHELLDSGKKITPRELKQKAEARGISTMTLHRARQELHVENDGDGNLVMPA